MRPWGCLVSLLLTGCVAVCPVSGQTVTFDFDSGNVVLHQPTPFEYTKDGLTARFSSVFDPASFSIQNHFTLSLLPGNFIYDNQVEFRNPLDIAFGKALNAVSVSFATLDHHTRSPILLTAYMDSNLIGSARAQGLNPNNEAYPQGTLSFNSGGQPFNRVRIEIPVEAQPVGYDPRYLATGFMADGITVTLASSGPPGLRFVAMAPCRVLETRPEYNYQGRTGAFGPPFLLSGETRTIPMPQSTVCPIPAGAKAYVLNVTLVPRGGLDYVTVWPAGDARPAYWTARSPDAQIVANTAIVRAGSGGAVNVYASNDADLLLDIAGYYTDNPSESNLVYYPLTPCRVIDTRLEYRSPPGPFGPPSMMAGETRRFTFPATPYCQVPAGAAAYSVTITAVPPAPLAFLTAWPAGSAQPNVSSINSLAGRILANSVIVPASSNGGLDIFTYNATDFLVDINGYYAPDDGAAGLYYFPVTQCRAANTTSASYTGAFGGPAYADNTTRSIPVPSSPYCTGIPAGAKAYAVNVTALPGGSPMPFLTLYPTGQQRPNASILNAFEGQIITNSAIIPAGAGGAIDVYAFKRTDVVLEISGYFGR